MRPVEEEDFDRLLNQMRGEFQKLRFQEDIQCTSEDTQLYHCNGFCLTVPPGFIEIGQEDAAVIYFSKNRPKVILLNREAAAGFSLQKLESSQNSMETQREQLKQILRRGDDRTVFYGMGQEEAETPVLWFEYKSFAADERVYNIMFLFRAGEKTIMGTFYCIFKHYDRWKPEVLHTLRTIRTSVR